MWTLTHEFCSPGRRFDGLLRDYVTYAETTLSPMTTSVILSHTLSYDRRNLHSLLADR